MFQSLTLITGNPGKLANFQRHLKISVTYHDLDLEEIQSLDLKEVLEVKAKAAFDSLKTPVLVDDTSLVFNALNGLPGPFIKWFLKGLGNEGLCKLLDGYEDRSAKATVGLGLYNGKEFYLFEASITGSIAKTPRGDKSFGWDPTFIPDGYPETRAEMNEEDEEKTNARVMALRKLEEFLDTKLP